MNLKAWCEGWGIPCSMGDSGKASFVALPAQLEGLGDVAIKQLQELDDFALTGTEKIGRGAVRFEFLDRKYIPQEPAKEKPLPKWFLPVGLYQEEMNYIEEMALKLRGLGMSSDGLLCLEKLLRYFGREDNEAYQAMKAADSIEGFRYE